MGDLIDVLRKIQDWLERNEQGETQLMTVKDTARVIRAIADELEELPEGDE